jgi:hypothetical protein
MTLEGTKEEYEMKPLMKLMILALQLHMHQEQNLLEDHEDV